VPEFKAWLDSESQLEMPKDLPPASPAALPMNSIKSGGTAPSPALGVGPKPGTAPSPALSGVNPGTAPAMALGATAKPGTAPARALPARPVAPRPVVEDEVNVELVTMPPAPALPQALPVTVKDDRGLLEFDRRDWIMLAAGAASVLAAVGVGYGLARLVRKKPEETPPEE
jgi:eukaryotic-like serine/threonine-protein kinase